ncbi:MAG: hypothetical protein CVU97_01535 [Firmicutes bacterium HGW-Firmicutes-21]|nr:MAG: hypothetical protein CVU97_01535 [Firmicutes bacterium HGW-Firmicutes-21]
MNEMPDVLTDDYRAEKDRYFYYKRVFLYSFVIAVAITVPFVLVELIKTGRPIFLYYGDYNAQQIAFYEHCVDMVRSGNIYWDWYTDLGSNFIGSYSYYMLGSPFFWLMCLFPASWAPYLMAPIYILKYITAAMIAYAYIKRFVKRQNYAVIGALLYAFCGFQIYNVFFNQFHEVVAFFPLLLLGIEELVQNNRRGLFAFAVAINAMCNYFMFAGQVVFCILYFLFRLPQKSFAITLRKFFMLMFEAVIGVLIAAIIILPGGLALVGNTRLNRHYSGWDMLFFRKDGGLYWQRYGHLFSSFFFPPDIPSRVNFFEGHTERWASIAAYVPMFGMSGVFAFFATKKRSWLKFLTIFLIACLFIPILNSMFFLFNSTYYARWMYMLVLMMIMATVIMLDDDSEKANKKWRGGIIAYLIGVTAIFVPLGLLWYNKNPGSDIVRYTLGRPPYMVRFWIYTGIALASIAVLWYLFKKVRGTPMFEKTCLLAVSSIIVLYSVVHITNGKEHSWSSKFMVDQAINGEVVLNDEEFFRIDFFRNASISPFDNLGLYWGYPSIECFHTVVPPSIMHFYPKIDVTRNVGSRAETKYFGLRAFSSVKYSFIDTSKTKSHDKKGFSYYDTQNGFDIYLNTNYLTMGFAYTEFMTETEFEKVPRSKRHALLCTYLVVPDDKAEYYSNFMTEVSYQTFYDEVYKNDLYYHTADEKYKVDSTYYTTFWRSVNERKAMASDSFTFESSHFTSHITLDSKNVVFFSVPYDKGWSATVNGEKKEVLGVTYGFMAVECEAGENNIVFTYRAEGMDLGIGLTISALLILLAYIIIGRKKGSRPTYRFFKEDYYEEDEMPVLKAAKSDKSIPTDTVSADESVDNSDTEQPGTGSS